MPGAFLVHVKEAVEMVSQWKSKLKELNFDENQGKELTKLIATLSKEVVELSRESETLRESYSEQIWRKSAEHRNRIIAARQQLASGQISNTKIFRRTIVTIFKGPEDDDLDSKVVKAKKQSTRQRCETIRGCSPGGILNWASALSSSKWSASDMSLPMFQCLIRNVEPGTAQSYSPQILETLEMIKNGNAYLHASAEYEAFIQGVRETTGQTGEGSQHANYDGVGVKRIRTERFLDAIFQNPDQYVRFSCVDYRMVNSLPEPFCSFVQKSSMWVAERAAGYADSNCIAVYAPEDDFRGDGYAILMLSNTDVYDNFLRLLGFSRDR